MAILGASFQIGRSALAAYQAAIAVSGQNIANVANRDYTRQTGRLSTQAGGPVFGGVSPGGGVRLSELRRHVDEALEARMRHAAGARAAGMVVYQNLSRIESIQNELSDTDVSTMLSNLFGSFAQLQADPQEAGARNMTIAAADGLVNGIRRQRSALLGQVRDLNQQAVAATARVTTLAREVANLNPLIVNAEADGVTVAGALRDRRDALLREMSELVDVTTREQPNGNVNVYIGSDPLVEFNRARGLATELVHQDGIEIARVRFADNNGTVLLTEGSLAGVVKARDEHTVGQLRRLDQLARGLIYEVNRRHSTGVGTVGYRDLTSNYAVRDAGAPLNSEAAGLPFDVKNGTLLVRVRDVATDQVITRQIKIDLDGMGAGDTTLSSLAADLNGVPGISARVTPDLRLAISADAGSEFWFNDDHAGVLAALGAASFFAGTDAGSIDVDGNLRRDARLLATSASGAAYEGSVAGALAQLTDPSVTSGLLDNLSINDFHTATVSRLAVDAAEGLTSAEANDAVWSALYAQRESISGVSLDEEAIDLTRFERAYQGAARYLGTLNSLMNDLLAIVR